MKKSLVFLLAFLLAGVLSACQKESASGAMLAERERNAVLAFSEPIMDNLFAGWNDDNYTVFSKDFDPDIMESIPQEGFDKLRKDEYTGLGRYFSRDVESVVKRSDGSYTVIYYAVFENNNEVLVRVTFSADDPHKISGLSFNK